MAVNAAFTDFSFDDTAVAFAYKSNAQLRHAQTMFELMNRNWLVKLGTALTPLAFRLHLPVSALVKATIFKQFCGGETLEACVPIVDTLAKYNVGVILDYGVEAKVSDVEFEKSTQAFIRSLEFSAQHPSVNFVSLKMTAICSFALLEKINRNETLTSHEQQTWQQTKERLDRICQAAQRAGSSLMIDAEETWIQQPIDDLTNEMIRAYNRERAVVFNTVQLYRKDRFDFLMQHVEQFKSENVVPGFKLVRGAYMEKERARAAKLGYPSPIQPDKNATDTDYNRAATYCLENIERVNFSVASHNEFSNWKTASDAASKHVAKNHPHLHFSQLYGMSDNISFNLAREGYNVTKYLPYGPVRDVVPYLMRRAQENTSVAGQTSRELQLITKEMKRRKTMNTRASSANA